MIEVRKHKGRSGKSVYEWRVYRVWGGDDGRKFQTQLTKRRSQEAAERDAEFYRRRDAEIEARDGMAKADGSARAAL